MGFYLNKVVGFYLVCAEVARWLEETTQ